MSGEFLLIYICNFHVLSHLLLICICELHWNQTLEMVIAPLHERVMEVAQECYVKFKEDKQIVSWHEKVHRNESQLQVLSPTHGYVPTTRTSMLCSCYTNEYASD
jgi:hypothetical protein